MAAPRVEFLWWEECPSWERALAGLAAAMKAAGLDPEAIEQRRIASEQEARAEEFVGSPTIRVDGRDVEPPGIDQQAALTCRLYRRGDGRASPLPDPDKVHAALARARAVTGTEPET